MSHDPLITSSRTIYYIALSNNNLGKNFLIKEMRVSFECMLWIEIRVVVVFLNFSHFCLLPKAVLPIRCNTQDNQTFTKGQFGQTELKTMQLFTQEKYTAVHCNQWASLRFYGQWRNGRSNSFCLYFLSL